MTLSTRRFGVLSSSVQLVGLALYGILLINQHISPSVKVGSQLLAISVRLVLGAAVLALIGLFVDRKKTIAIISLAATLPILLLMAGWQGIW